jgi:phage gpG-like protein
MGESGSDIVNIAIWNHMGTRRDGKLHIPARPYMDITMDRIDSQLASIQAYALEQIQSGTPVNRALAVVGLFLQAEMQQTIADLKDPPNSPSTIARKGFDNPLIHKGRLRASIAFTVRLSK